MIKAIIFDCFGVLLADVLRARIASVRQVNPGAAQGLSDIVRAYNRGFLTREESAEKMGEIFKMQPDVLLAELDGGEVKNVDLVDFAKTLRPRFKVALLSNVGSRETLDDRLGRDELDAMFDVIVASGDTGMIKPEPGIYELVAQKLGVAPEECVMIDDVEEYCRGAEAVGMKSIHFESNEQGIAALKQLIG